MHTMDFANSTILDRSENPMPHVPKADEGGNRLRRGLHLVQLHDGLWRVTRTDGDVLGYVECFMDPRGPRFRSKRLIALQKRFVVLGDFWAFDDAVDCLRFG